MSKFFPAGGTYCLPQKKPSFGVRKLAERFGCGRSQVSEILKSKDMILKEWEINESCSGKKRENPQKFLRINEYLWKWYVLCRHSNVPVSELMLQEEGDVSQETLSSWDERSRELMRGYEPRNVWNMDETGQFWRALPDKSLSERGKRCCGGKN